MSELRSVRGFFLQIGSDDYPFNISPEQPFGLLPGNVTPDFRYSYLDVIDRFIDPQKLTREGEIYQSRSSQTIVESRDYGGIGDIDPTTEEWRNIFFILEKLYNEQNTAMQNPSLPLNELAGTGWRSLADEWFSTGLDLPQNREGSKVPGYIERSLYIVRSSTRQTRIGSVQFKFTINGSIIDIEIYFDANMWVESQLDPVRASKVYVYTETVEDGIIDQSEFTGSIQQVVQIQREGSYKSLHTLDVRKVVDEVDAMGNPTGAKIETNERFFIFSKLSQTSELMNQIMLRKIVKEYLQTKHSSITYLSNTYPDLFSGERVDIIPLIDNQVSEFGHGQIHSKVHPLPLSLIQTKLSAYGYEYNPLTSSYRPTEVFYVGGLVEPGSPEDQLYAFPLLAIETGVDSAIVERPISQRYPRYVPAYGLSYSPSNDRWKTFQHLMILALGVATGQGSSMGDIPNEIKTEYGMNLIENPSAGIGESYVEFTFDQTTWVVYKVTLD